MTDLDLVLTLALPVLVGVVSRVIEGRRPAISPWGVLLQGALFGGAAAWAALRGPVGPGFPPSAGAISVCLCALFLGLPASASASAVAIALPLGLGAPGALAGTLAILSAAAIGGMARFCLEPAVRPPSAGSLYLVGFAVQTVLLGLGFALGGARGSAALAGIALFPLAMVLAGGVLSNRTGRGAATRGERDGEAFLETLLDAIPIPIFYKDRVGRYLGCNEAFEAFLGVPRERLRGRTVFEVTPPERGKVHQDKDVDLLRSGGVQRYEFQVRNAQGEERDVLFHKAVFRDQEGLVGGLIGAIFDITERKRAEEELRDSNEMLRAVVEAAPTAIVGLDLEGNVRWVWNRAAEEMLGWRADEVMGRPLPTVPAVSDDEFTGFREQVRAGLTLDGVEVRRLRRDGTPIEYSIHASPLRDAEGNVTGNVAVLLEIGARKQAERELIESERKFRSLAESAPDNIIRHDRAGRVVYVNTHMISTVREDFRPPIGKTLEEGREEAPRPEYVEKLEEVLLTGQPGVLEIVVPDPQGEMCTHHIRFVPERGEDGEVVGALAIGRDITDRKRAEEALRASETKLRSILENIGIGVALISPKLEVLELNRRMRRWFPQIDPAARHSCYRVFHDPPRDGVCDYCPTRKTLQDGQVYEATAETVRPGGLRQYRIVSSPVFDAAGQVTAAIEIVEDITQRMSLEEQLRQSQKMDAVGQLAGGVAHDFNNMLSVILGHAELALMRTDPADPLRGALDEILGAAERSADLTRQLLAFARKQTVAPEVLDLNETVEGMLKMLRRLIGEDLQLVWQPGSGVWPIKVDPSQVDQILANLCVNARDAIAGVGTVTIETGNATFGEADLATHPGATPGDFVKLAVSDDGCGMDPETRERIFEPFFTTKEQGKGTGLGLATVYGIVQQNQGFIEVHSEPGHGTTLALYLPRHGQGTETVAPEPQAAPLPRGHETLILVEDEPAILDLARIVLEELDYRVLTAARPGEAIRLAREYGGVIDLLVTDVVMPEMNGRDLAERIADERPQIRTLFMSGYTGKVIAHHGVMEEGLHFLRKPFTVHSLALKVRETLDAK